MESSRRDLFINMVLDGFIFSNEYVLPCFTFIFIPKTGVGLPNIGVSFHCVGSVHCG